MPVSTQTVTRLWIFIRLRARKCSSSPTLSSGVLSRFCRRDGWAGPARRPWYERERCAREGFVEQGYQDLGSVRLESGDKAREGFVSARVVFSHDQLTRVTKSGAGTVGATQVRLATKWSATRSGPADRRRVRHSPRRAAVHRKKPADRDREHRR